VVISHELKDVIGVEETNHFQIIKLLWAYIKENNLQNPKVTVGKQRGRIESTICVISNLEHHFSRISAK
jgi:hypothetical protein